MAQVTEASKMVIVIQSDGCPHAEVTTLAESRRVLRQQFYGTGGLHVSDVRDELERWQHFSNLENWSIDMDGGPFGYEYYEIKAYFLSEGRVS